MRARADLDFGGATMIREAPGCPVRQRVLAASIRGCCLRGSRGAGGAGRREPLCARAQSYTRLALLLRCCRITSRIRSWRMETPSDQAADLPARVAQWIAGGETYEVEFKGERRERLNDRDLVRLSGGIRGAGVQPGPQDRHARR